MANETTSGSADEIRGLLGSESLIIGTEKSMKLFKANKLAKLFMSANCPDNIREDVSNIGKMVETEVVELEETNEDLGVVCRKPFSISVLGFLKG